MELKEKIEEIRASVLREIEDSARRGDSQGIAAKIRTVEAAERLAKQWHELSSAVYALEKSMTINESDQVILEKGSPIVSHIAITGNENQDLSPRARGDLRRKELLEHLATIGVDLAHVKGNNFYTKSNKLVGIAYASEINPNRWFLGLPDDDYDLVSLICEKSQSNIKTVNYFTITKQLYDRYRKSLSVSKGQRKYNIIVRRDIYYLIVPNEDPISLNGHINNDKDFIL